MKSLVLTLSFAAFAFFACQGTEQAAAQKPKAHKSVVAAKSAAVSAPSAAEPEQPADASTVFKAPKGAKAAIVVFEDLQCPMCSKAAPQVEKASATYKIPVIRHDFPLPKHDWSLQAAIIAPAH